MTDYFGSIFPLLDIAPLGWAGLFIIPVLVIAVVIVAAVVLIKTIGKRKSERRAAQMQTTDQEKRE